MYTKLSEIALVVFISALLSGCFSLNDTQRNIAETQPSAYDDINGVIVGSVTAPISFPYHHTVLFEYRSEDGDMQHKGVLTSGMKHRNFLIDIPTCSETDIPWLCGRLFVVSLPAGNYKISEVLFREFAWFREMPPMRFTVTKGRILYLGNLHVSFCKGNQSYRRIILGGDVIIKDEYERDTALIRERFNAIRSGSIEKKLLPDLKWRMRIPYEPDDWGECGIPANKKSQSDG